MIADGFCNTCGLPCIDCQCVCLNCGQPYRHHDPPEKKADCFRQKAFYKEAYGADYPSMCVPRSIFEEKKKTAP